MRPIVILPVIAISAMLFTSCYMMSTQPTGSISVNLGSPSARTITTSSQVRVYLYTYASSTSYSRYTFPDGNNYQEFQYGTGTKTFTDLPAGLWDVLVSVGSDGPNGSFQTTDYGHSGPVSVVGGTTTSTSVTTQATPFAYSSNLLGDSLDGAVMDYYNYYANANGSSLYVSSSSALYYITPTNVTNTNGTYTIPNLTKTPPTQITVPSGLQIQSLSPGYCSVSSGQPTYCLYVNGSDGIVPFSFGITPNFDTTNFSYSLVDSGGNRYDVLNSAALLNSTGGATIYYVRNPGLGGVYIDGKSNLIPFNGTTGNMWVDIDLSALGVGNPVYEIAPDTYPNPSNGYAYFATKFGAFRTGPGLVTYGTAGAGNLNTPVYFTAPNDYPIQAVAIDDYFTDNTIYIGTPHGAYYATLNETSSTSAISGGWTPISETAGDNIVGIAIDNSSGIYGAPVTVALRSPYNLYTITGAPSQGGTVATYPFYAGLPGTLSAMDFAFGTLYVAGSTGLVSLLVNPPSGG